MQSVSSRIWTRVAVSISYDDNDYTTGTSINYTGMVHAVWNKSWKQHSTKTQLYGLFIFIFQTIQEAQDMCVTVQRSKDE